MLRTKYESITRLVAPYKYEYEINCDEWKEVVKALKEYYKIGK
ncbi:hypothetical protein SAMN02910264_02402 [Ruminococcaceae bacterium YAD3003]|nr:hypothetical protein SAMN02910264_02402 [Ruminococcaceae bacterium YAD3003]